MSLYTRQRNFCRHIPGTRHLGCDVRKRIRETFTSDKERRRSAKVLQTSSFRPWIWRQGHESAIYRDWFYMYISLGEQYIYIIYMRIYIYICAYTNLYTYKYTHMEMYAWICIYIYWCIHIHTFSNIYNINMYVNCININVDLVDQ